MENLLTTFRKLHHEPNLLILPNVWDAGSARVFEDAGAKAVATTSAGMAWALGYQDGNVLPTDKLAAIVTSITKVISIPLSVDFEGGYTDNPKEIAKKLKPIIEAGAVGINIEDGEGKPELLAGKIEQVRKTADSASESPEKQIQETIARAALYRDAGADGIFVPGLCEVGAVKAIVPEVKMPLNVMAWPGLPAANQLSKLGVRRLSSGQTITQVLWKHAADLAKNFLETGDSQPLTENSMGYSKLQGLFGK